jgi:transcriptional regulator with PAS, ATPase and Fis domain
LKDDVRRRFKAVVVLPPLAQRLEDVAHLARDYVLEHAPKDAPYVKEEKTWLGRVKEGTRRDVRLDREFVRWLVQQPWPGNVRDVHAAMEQSMIEWMPDEDGTEGPLMVPRELHEQEPESEPTQEDQSAEEPPKKKAVRKKKLVKLPAKVAAAIAEGRSLRELAKDFGVSKYQAEAWMKAVKGKA